MVAGSVLLVDEEAEIFEFPIDLDSRHPALWKLFPDHAEILRARDPAAGFWCIWGAQAEVVALVVKGIGVAVENMNAQLGVHYHTVHINGFAGFTGRVFPNGIPILPAPAPLIQLIEVGIIDKGDEPVG